MRYTLGTASKATGKSKTTIQRAISKGLISAEKGRGGEYSIDPSELHRVFPPLPSDTVSRDPKVDDTRPHNEAPELRAKIEALESMLIREREALDEVRADRDAWKQQATALLAAPPKRRRWWPW
ncbi:hypothetical protein D2T29_21915 [Sinirhodobacter populi]|uniref:Uncharacterized protein n=1 Tax=Paenirhodobacter populi TaxID=2306993 RepID=A0A443JYA1_9RHOB|nr:hypothetical protein [Sinirhodobacter populi]RWR25513.1 hypothetical protein D2T29_21915 [Sinirhodobacter populi]